MIYRKHIIKVGDLVGILSGNYKGKTGLVLDFDRKRGFVKVQGINLKTHFVKKDQNENQNENWVGIYKVEGWLPVCKVSLINAENDKPAKFYKKDGIRFCKVQNGILKTYVAPDVVLENVIESNNIESDSMENVIENISNEQPNTENVTVKRGKKNAK